MTGAPPTLEASLADAIRQLGLALDASAQAALLSYLRLLQHWNATFNLTSVRDPGQMLSQHLVDCLAVVNPLRRERGSRPGRVLDVGSGGGLPGVVLALSMPELDVTCVDTVGKKAAFIRQVAGDLGLSNLHAVHGRVEAMTGTFDVVVSRAFAALPLFCRLTRSRMASHGVWLAMKGRMPDEELAELPADVEVFHVEQLQVPGLDAERCLVWMRPA